MYTVGVNERDYWVNHLQIAAHLFEHVEAHHLGAVYAAETECQPMQNLDTVRAPDVAFVRQQRLEAVGESEGYWPDALDVAVEVVSPADCCTDVEEKVMEWLEAGSWIVPGSEISATQVDRRTLYARRGDH